ncbi:hypothetical protein B296_00034520, partial [Ensete ventricosum]
ETCVASPTTLNSGTRETISWGPNDFDAYAFGNWFTSIFRDEHMLLGNSIFDLSREHGYILRIRSKLFFVGPPLVVSIKLKNEMNYVK